MSKKQIQDTVIFLRCTSEQKAKLQAAADKDGRSLNNYILRQLGAK